MKMKCLLFLVFITFSIPGFVICRSLSAPKTSVKIIKKPPMLFNHMPYDFPSNFVSQPLNQQVKCNRESRGKWNGTYVTYHIVNEPKCCLRLPQVKEYMRKAFEKWNKYTNIIFEEIGEPERANISISFGSGNHSDIPNDKPFDGPGNISAHTSKPTFPGSHVMHFDNDEIWKLCEVDLQKNERDFFLVATHEAGHALGLTHCDHPESVMVNRLEGYNINKKITYNVELRCADILAIAEKYGTQDKVPYGCRGNRSSHSHQPESYPGLTNDCYGLNQMKYFNF